MVKVSIILPIYNAERTLRRALDSAIGQTYRDIEIICIDDASEDASADIIFEYAQNDPRIKYIRHTENCGSFSARRHGIQEASGAFILFLDPDDVLSVKACEILCPLMEEKQVDILQFPAQVLPADKDVSEAQILAAKNRLKLPQRMLRGEQIFLDHYCTHKYWHVLWNKIYRASVCKKAAAAVDDIYIVLCDDLYLFGLISFFSEKFCCARLRISLYQYYFGCGISTRTQVRLKEFRMICSASNAVGEMEKFLASRGMGHKFEGYCAQNRWELLKNTCRIWARQLALDDQAQGFDMLVSNWPQEFVVAALREDDFLLRSEVVKGTRGSQMLCCPAVGKVTTLGVYYPQLSNGGAERVIALLLEEWRKRYRVVLFTEQRKVGEYTIDDHVVRIELPPKGNVERYQVLQKSISQFRINLFMYHAWLERELVWDILSVKLCTVPCLVVAHSPLVYWQEWFVNELDYSECLDAVPLADGIVTLSNRDADYWNTRHMHAKCILNPCDPALKLLKRSSLQGYRILWIGRVAREKRLEDAIAIFEAVARELPAAELTIVGEGDDEVYNQKIERLLAVSPYRTRMHRVGYVKEPYHFYEEAAVLLVTSEFEGFSMVILEAKAAGVPCVSYDCPTSYFFQKKRGMITVEKGDICRAAMEIIDLLGRPERLHKFSEEAYESFQHYWEKERNSEWDAIFHLFEEGIRPIPEKDMKSAQSSAVRTAVRDVRIRLQEKDSRRFLRLGSIWRLFLVSSWVERIKIVGKLILTCFGKRVDFHEKRFCIMDDLILKLKSVEAKSNEDS